MRETGQAVARRGRRVEDDAPGEDGSEAADDCRVEDVVEEDAADEADDGGLDEEGKGRVGQGEVAVGELVERDAEAGVEQVAAGPRGRRRGRSGRG